MRLTLRNGFGLLVVTLMSGPLMAQPQKSKEEDFLKAKPALGESLPELTVYSPDGKEFKTADLKGHYTVLVFGCLT